MNHSLSLAAINWNGGENRLVHAMQTCWKRSEVKIILTAVTFPDQSLSRWRSGYGFLQCQLLQKFSVMLHDYAVIISTLHTIRFNKFLQKLLRTFTVRCFMRSDKTFVFEDLLNEFWSRVPNMMVQMGGLSSPVLVRYAMSFELSPISEILPLCLTSHSRETISFFFYLVSS